MQRIHCCSTPTAPKRQAQLYTGHDMHAYVHLYMVERSHSGKRARPTSQNSLTTQFLCISASQHAYGMASACVVHAVGRNSISHAWRHLFTIQEGDCRHEATWNYICFLLLLRRWTDQGLTHAQLSMLDISSDKESGHLSYYPVLLSWGHCLGSLLETAYSPLP